MTATGVVVAPSGVRLADERGAATVWALALVIPILLAGLIGLAVAQLALARQRVGAVADLAALAGAQAIADPCAAVAEVAAANDVTLAGCVVDGEDVRVDVTAETPVLVQRLLVMLDAGEVGITGSARAGPG